MYNSYLKSGRGSLLGCLHGKHLHLVLMVCVGGGGGLHLLHLDILEID